MTDEILTCRSCEAPVVFARNVDTGRRMILNAAIDLERGNVLVDPRGQEARCRVVDRDTAAQEREAGSALYLPHHATCPDAARWRKRGQKR